jgi:hypothetical protein
VYRLQEPTTARLFVTAVLAELEAGGARVAQCLQCGNLFERERRQAFCSIQCAQRARDARRRSGGGASIEPLPGHQQFVGLGARTLSLQGDRRKKRSRA